MQMARVHGGGGSMPSLQAIDSSAEYPASTIDLQVRPVPTVMPPFWGGNIKKGGRGVRYPCTIYRSILLGGSKRMEISYCTVCASVIHVHVY